jgi:hypothetical protein
MCLKMSLHVMKHGFFNKVRKRRGNRRIGRHHITENEKGMNAQVECEGNDDRFLHHQRHNHD